MKNNRDFQIEKTGYNYRPRKYSDILAVVLDANNKVIDAIAPETDNHRTTLDWAEWRAESIRNDYPAAIRMEVYCGNEEIAVISFLETPNPDNTPTTMNANESGTRKKSINCIMNQANSLMSVCNGAREISGGKGYIIASVKELAAKYGTLCHYETTAPGADAKRAWGLQMNEVHRKIQFTAI